MRKEDINDNVGHYKNDIYAVRKEEDEPRTEEKSVLIFFKIKIKWCQLFSKPEILSTRYALCERQSINCLKLRRIFCDLFFSPSRPSSLLLGQR